MIPVFATAGVLNAPPAPLQSSGFVPGNTLPAQMVNYWLFHLTSELVNLLNHYGLSQNTADDTQVTQAVQIAGRVEAGATTALSISPYNLAPSSVNRRFSVGSGSGTFVFNLCAASAMVGSGVVVIENDSPAGSGMVVQVNPNGSDVWGSGYSGLGSAAIYLGSPGQIIVLTGLGAGRLSILGGNYEPAHGVDANGSDLNLGKLHHLPLGNATSRQIVSAVMAAGFNGPYTATGSFGIPAGAKAVRLKIDLQVGNSSGGTPSRAIVLFSDNNSATPSALTAHPMIDVGFVYATSIAVNVCSAIIDVPLDSLGRFYVYGASYSGITTGSYPALAASAIGYYMGD